MKRTIFLFFLFFCTHSFAQKVAIKNNLAYDALKTPNLSLEFSMGRKWTLDTQVGMNFFFYTQDATSSRYKTKKASHWLVQPELRYWTCDVFNGWFFGLHAHGGQMNIGGIDVPFVLQKGDGKMKEHRYEGYFWGGGLSAGYQWVVSNRFNIEASLGIGYVHTRYDKYKCTTCGKKEGKGDADYIGPGGQDALHKRVVIRGRGVAAVIADDRAADAPAGQIGAAGFPEMGYPFGVEILVHDAANIISAKYVACVHFFPPDVPVARCKAYKVCTAC